MDIIPKKIHLISRDKTPAAPYLELVSQIHELHPDWEISIWDDETALSIVKQFFPEWVPYYCAYTIPIQRVDIFRTMIVYLKGGFYLDMDMQCLKKLDDLCQHGMVIAVEKKLAQQQCAKYGHSHSVRIANYMFGSRPHHGFWLDFLYQAKARADMVIRRESDVLEATGPGLLTHVYHENSTRYNDIVVLINDDRSCQIACGPASCHFGDYAVHLHFGTWRWEINSASHRPGNAEIRS